MRGFWYIIEAMLAGIILIGFLLALAGGYLKLPYDDISLRSYGILHELDQQDMLRGYVSDWNYSGLNSQISLFGYNHSVQICDQSGSCAGNRPGASGAGDVWAGNYIISGDENYQPRLVRLYMWRLTT